MLVYGLQRIAVVAALMRNELAIFDVHFLRGFEAGLRLTPADFIVS